MQVYTDSLVFAPDLTGDAVDLEGAVKNDTTNLGVVNQGLGKIDHHPAQRTDRGEKESPREALFIEENAQALEEVFARTEPEVEVLQVVQCCGDHDLSP
jgi:hypothetical protein